jgi:phosphatidylserine/phosphatidylglycerophosphate/cardiolipin synthase-like enzyme
MVWARMAAVVALWIIMNKKCVFIRRSGLILALTFILLVPVSVAAAPTQVYFSPNGGAEKALVELLDGARQRICVAIYYFTNRTLAAAVVRAQERGVKIRVIIDGTNESDYSKGYYLRKHGVTVRYARGLPKKIKKSKKRKHRVKKYGIMHNKFVIVDDQTVATGSFNWTASAEQWNRENLLIIKSSSLARRYTSEFDKIWETTFKK